MQSVIDEPTVVGVDPPQGLAVWGEGGPILLCEGYGEDSRDRAADLAKIVRSIEWRVRPALCVIEHPFRRDTENPGHSLVLNGVSAGIIEGCFRDLWGAGLEEHDQPQILTPPGNTWRAWIGMNRPNRATAKEAAIMLAVRICDEFCIVHPGGEGHVDEALCMALGCWKVAWKRGLVPGGVVQRWLEKGSWR